MADLRFRLHYGYGLTMEIGALDAGAIIAFLDSNPSVSKLFSVRPAHVERNSPQVVRILVGPGIPIAIEQVLADL